jgi:hypothetical protein
VGFLSEFLPHPDVISPPDRRRVVKAKNVQKKKSRVFATISFQTVNAG